MAVLSFFRVVQSSSPGERRRKEGREKEKKNEGKNGSRPWELRGKNLKKKKVGESGGAKWEECCREKRKEKKKLEKS